MVKKTIIPATKKLGKELIKEASPEHKLRVCAYVRVSTDSEEQLESFNAQIGRYKRIIQEEHADIWEYVGYQGLFVQQLSALELMVQQTQL